MRSNWFRLAGLGLLIFLIWRADIGSLGAALSETNLVLVAIAVALNLPHVFPKVLRWRGLLASHQINYSLIQATLAHFSSLFIGFITPGRLGDFARVLHVSQDCGVSVSRAFSTVFIDRLFDLYAVLIMGAIAFVILGGDDYATTLVQIVVIATVFLSPLLFLVSNPAFSLAQNIGLRFGSWTGKLIGPDGWLTGVRDDIRTFTIRSLSVGALLTAVSLAIFLGQAMLLARALDLSASLGEVTFAVTLGSLAALVPISISGLGTREAAIVTYLGTTGTSSETALAFSLLLFLTFYLALGLIGAVAWLIKPMPIKGLKSMRPGKSQVERKEGAS